MFVLHVYYFFFNFLVDPSLSKENVIKEIKYYAEKYDIKFLKSDQKDFDHNSTKNIDVEPSNGEDINLLSQHHISKIKSDNFSYNTLTYNTHPNDVDMKQFTYFENHLTDLTPCLVDTN